MIKLNALLVLGLSCLATFVKGQSDFTLKNIRSENSDTRETVEIRIDPTSALANEGISNIAESITYLPLQTTKESAFGDVTQLEVTDNLYIIWDKVSNCILFFDKKGGFVTKISSADRSLPKPYLKIDHFTVNEAKNELMFNDRWSPYLYFFTLEGKFIKCVEKPEYLGYSYINFGDFGVYYQSYKTDFLKKMKAPLGNLIIKDKNNNAAVLLPIDTTSIKDFREVLGVDRNLYDNHDGVVYITNTYDYKVYSLDTKAKVRTAFRFVMPALNTLPDDFLTNDKYKGQRKAYTNAKGDVIYALTNFYKRGNNLLFNFKGHSRDQTMSFNLKTQNLACLSDMLPDKLTHDLPFMGEPSVTVDKSNGVIMSVSSGLLFDYKARLQGKKEWAANLPESLKTFFKKGSQQNPVLAIMTLK